MLSPRENQDLFGHTQAKEHFLNAFHSSRFPHAWIFAGDFGVGKATFAFHMARYILSRRDNKDTHFSDDDPLYRRVAAQSQEDLWVVGEEKSPEIGVEIIRNLNTVLTQTSRGGGWRIIIIDGAERLNNNAANALLKRLEEPPPKTVFFLVTHLPGHLLPTIRSRCQFLFFSPLADEDVKQVMAAQNLSLPSFSSLMQGSPGRLMRVIKGEGAHIFGDLQNILKGENATPFIHTHGGNETSYDLVEDMLRTFLYTRIMSTIEDQELVPPMLATYETITQLFEQCRFAQLDKKATLSCVLAEMRK